VAQFTAEGLVQFAPEWVAHFAAEPVVGFHRNTQDKADSLADHLGGPRGDAGKL